VTSEGPRLYNELADWYHLLTSPHEYVAEASAYRDLIEEDAQQPVKTILELGCGGGANASHLKRHYEMTLSDVSEPMLAQSRKINSELEHLVGDMRTLRLNRTFDAVMIHDAIDYMTNKTDLGAAIQTAAEHLRQGGLALFFPDHIKETFEGSTDHGGHDDDQGRGLRYVEWTWDPDPNDDTYIWDFAYMMRDQTGDVQVMHDRHICGVFSKATWLDLMQQAGLEPTYRNLPHPEVPPGLNALTGTKG